MSNQVYQFVTDRILKEMEKGIIPWHKSWKNDGSVPMNLITKKQYRGMNLLLLPYHYTSPFFLTFKQCKKLGGNVKKGENSYMVVFWKFFKSEDKDGNEKKIPLLRYYRVFNVDQTEGIDPAKIPLFERGEEIEPIEAAELIINNMPNRPHIDHGECIAYYKPSTDTVNMPKKDLFENSEEYYQVLFHEVTHSTGHRSRCNRGIENNAGYGSVTYSKEELVAEMGSAFLCRITGIDSENIIKQTASYINGWMDAIKKDNKLIVTAAGKAQKAADYIQGIKNEYKNTEAKKPEEKKAKPRKSPQIVELQTFIF